MAAVGFGVVPFFAKSLADAGIAAPAIAFYRYILTAVALLPFLALRPGDRAATGWGVLAGVVMGIGWISYVDALKTVPVSSIGVLYMTYPIFTVLIAWIWFGERPAGRSILASLIILGAAILAMSPAAVGSEALPAMLIAITAPLGFGFGINVLIGKLTRIPPLSRVACVTLGAAVGLMPLVAGLESGTLIPDTPRLWWMIAGIAVATALVPQLVYTVFAPRIGAARTAMAGSVELPTMFIIAWLGFGESIGPAQLAAGVMVLAAIVITPVRRAPPASS